LVNVLGTIVENSKLEFLQKKEREFDFHSGEKIYRTYDNTAETQR
jgi:hypothetical protein